MELIVIKGPEKKPYTFSLKMYHFVAAMVALFIMTLAVFTFGMVLSAYYGDQVPVISKMEQTRMINRELAGKDLSAPLDAMAIRLAELQAQVARLNAIGNRLLEDNSIDAEDLEVTEPLGQGGLRQEDEEPISFHDLGLELESVANSIDRQADILSVIDSDMRTARVRFQSMPNQAPLADPISVSRFGSRIDPFTGRRSRHDGIDYTARTGTPILAAAAGVVVRSGYHPGYGYMVDLEHANNTLTRYAHASKLYVKKGDIVRVGEKIALVGSTGRSTGPHLHFEVRVNGVPKNPTKFIAQGAAPRPGAATVAALNGLLSESIHEPIQ